MTNFIEKLKQVAAGRHADPFDKDDKKIAFDELADNCFDELVAVAQIADNIWHSGLLDKPETKHIDDLLEKSLIALRQKVEGEGG